MTAVAKRTAVVVHQITRDDTVTAINAEHQAAQRGAADAVQHAVRCGQLLIEKKAGLKHGEFMPWIETHCQVPRSTATVYMKAARQIAKGLAISSLSRLFGSGKTRKRTAKKPRATLEHSADEQYEERFNVDVAITKIVQAVRSILANWPDHVDTEPLAQALREEADRLLKTKRFTA
jgi:hypothetical protein